jgi:hypothetical protein
MIICSRFQANNYSKICILLRLPTFPEATERLLAMMLLASTLKRQLIKNSQLSPHSSCNKVLRVRLSLCLVEAQENVSVVMNPIDHTPAGAFHFSLAQYKQNIIA